MRTRSALFLLILSLRRRYLRSLGVIGGLAIGMLALGLAVGAGLGAGRSLSRHLRTMFPAQRVILQPRNLDILFLRLEKTRITPDTVAKIRALPGVRRISPEATIRFPISAEGSLAGSVYRSDITVTGVEKWLLDDRAPGDFAYHPGSPLPTILSEYFLDLYNMSLAESNNLPKFSPSAVIGRDFTMILGESSLHSQNPSSTATLGTSSGAGRLMGVPARIAGLTNNPDLLGLILPLDAVEQFNAWYGIPDKAYRALHVELESPESVERLKEALPTLGLEMKDRQGTWRRVLQIVWLAGGGFIVLGGLVFALSLAYMASTLTSMLAQRRRELAVFGALGAAPRQLMVLLMGEIALTSFLGITIGLGGAAGGLAAADHWYRAWRSYRTFLPENIFSFPYLWIFGLGMACWLIALFLAWLRVTLIVRQPVTRMLSD